MKKLILGFVLGILVVGIPGYFLFVKDNDKKECENEKVDKEETAALKTISLTASDTKNFQDWSNIEDKDAKVTINNIKYNDETTKIEFNTEVLSDNSVYKMVTINGREVVRNDFECGGPSLPIIANGMIFIGYHNGCDIFGDSLEIYDFKGNLINRYEYLDLTIGMRLSKWEIKDNKLLLDGTRGTHGPNILTNKTDMDGYYLCDLNDLAKGKIKDTDIMGATYEVSYLGDYKFSTLKMLNDKTTTVGEIRKAECK